MTQAARKPPTSVKPQARRTVRKTGTPTTNQMSRAPKRKKRAADRTLIARRLDRSWRILVLDLALPSARGKATSATAKLTSSAAAIVHSEPRKPRASRRKLPRKKPAPFSAFFEPVRIATHLNSDDSASAGTSTLMALLALILVR